MHTLTFPPPYMPTLPTAEKYALPSSLSMKGKRLEVCPIVGPLRIRF